MSPKRSAKTASEAARPKVSDEDGGRWLRRILSEIQTIEVGSTRGQLLETFEPDGGLSPIPNPRFVHRRYPIKFDVEFSPRAPRKAGNIEMESEDDVIVSISRPYLGTKKVD